MRATIDWYVNTLDFEEAAYIPKWNWGQVIKDGIRIMFGKPGDFAQHGKSAFTGSIYLNVDDVESLWQKLKDAPFILYPLETFEYEMKEFAIKDINGYILQFGQDVSGAGT